MSIPILFLILCAVAIGATSFNKLCSNMIVGFSVARYLMYFTVNGIVACIFFAIFGALYRFQYFLQVFPHAAE